MFGTSFFGEGGVRKTASLGLETLVCVSVVCGYTPAQNWMGLKCEVCAPLVSGSLLVSRTPSRRSLRLLMACFDSTDKDKVDDDWVAFEVLGPLPFDMVGVMAQLSNTLASAGVSLLAQSSYDTDYIFVKEKDADQATVALVKSGVGLGAEKN